MQSSGRLILPELVTVDLRICVNLPNHTAGWGWKVTDLLTSEPIWICSHPDTELLPSGRWLARSLLEGSDVIAALVRGEVFPPACHGRD